MVYFDSEDSTMEKGTLDIKNARFEKEHLKDSNIKLFGFTLTSKGQQVKFYHTDQAVIQEWTEALKETVISIDIHTQWDIGDFIGSGSFARVHICTKKNDPGARKYAVKTIIKQELKKTKRNI